MGGSQLTQLKSRIKEQGLSRHGNAGPNKKRKLSNASRDEATNLRTASLLNLHNEFNTFDTKFNKQKHAIGNTRPAKGKPAVAKSSAIENRRKTILPELLDRSRSGGIIDKRFGENNPYLTPEEKALERFASLRQSRGNTFNLEDDDVLTHYGKSLAHDDAEPGLGGQEDLFQAHLRGAAVNDDIEQPERKRSTKEIMEEVMAKSKAYKYERQKVKSEDDLLRISLDQDLNSLRSALGLAVSSRSQKRLVRGMDSEDEHNSSKSDSGNDDGSENDDESEDLASADEKGALQKNSQTVDRSLLNRLINPPSPEHIPKENGAALKTAEEESEDDYDRHVRELGFDKRVRPTDRLKTEEEKARIAADALKAQESARLKRMRGEDATAQRHRGGDDLDDDFVADGDEFGLGAGLIGEADEALAVSLLENDEKINTHSASVSEDESDEDLSGHSDRSSDDIASNAEDLAAELAELEQEHPSDTNVEDLVASNRLRRKEAAFVVACPQDHDEFLTLLGDQNQLATVIDRIRTLYHPSLDKSNGEKLSLFCTVLIDHALYCTSRESSPAHSLNLLSPHIISLSKAYPLPSARHFIDKLVLMQKNLTRGLSTTIKDTEAKTWPGLPEIALLRLVGLIWSTSDFSNPVVAPAMLLICQYLNQCRIRSAQDLRMGLFLCTLCLQFEHESKRIIPEALNFLAMCLWTLAPHQLTLLPFSFPIGTQDQAIIKQLKIAQAGANPTGRLSLSNPTISKESLLATCMKLVKRFSLLYQAHSSFIEMFQPFLDIIKSIQQSKLPRELQLQTDVLDNDISRMLSLSKSTRKPLVLQHFKPAPIQTYAPRFEEGYRPGQHAFDPDVGRNEQAKLKAAIKKEKKGALRELRKDSRFIATERSRLRQEKDEEYNKKIGRIRAGLQEERSEEKGYERTKKRLKRQEQKRAGK